MIKLFTIAMTVPAELQQWFIPLSEHNKTLGEAYAEMQAIGYRQEAIPLIIQVVENPKYALPGLNIFNGQTDLETHDYIHLILGRGVLPKDEAFVLGFTMGSTHRMHLLEEKLYGIFSRFLYPRDYRFSDDDFQVYKNAVRLAYISNCQPLDKVDYKTLLNIKLGDIRQHLGLETDLLKAYYRIEKQRYPDAEESRRLLTGFGNRVDRP